MHEFSENSTRQPEAVIQDVISMVYSRSVYLGPDIPSHIESRWNFPPITPRVRPRVMDALPIKGGRFSIAHHSIFGWYFAV